MPGISPVTNRPRKRKPHCPKCGEEMVYKVHYDKSIYDYVEEWVCVECWFSRPKYYYKRKVKAQ